MATMKKFKKIASYLFIYLMPISISTTSVDSSQTQIQIFGDLGQYGLMARDCNGVSHKKAIGFKEVSAGVNHKINKNISVGISAEIVNDLKQTKTSFDFDSTIYSYSKRNSFVITPKLDFTFKVMSFGIAYSYTSAGIYDGIGRHSWIPGAYYRIGPPILNFRAQVFYDQPFYLNGFGSLGLNSTIFKKTNMFIGVNLAPYDAFGSLVKVFYHPKPGLSYSAIFRLGRSEGINEYAFGLGMSWVLH